LWNWYRSDLLTRLKPGGRMVLIMTRWHEDDLGGRLLAQEPGWRCIRLPALAEADDPLGRALGAPLWPEWESAAELERKRDAMGARGWYALFQQAPRPDGGTMVDVSLVPLVDSAIPEISVRGWDLAATAAGSGDPDWTVGVQLCRQANGLFVVTDVVRLRGSPYEVEAAILAAAGRDGPGTLISLPQDPGQAGKMQAQYLIGQLAGYRVRASPETGSKTTRAAPMASQIEAGNLALLRAPWNGVLLEELGAFPSGLKDDQVDALGRAFNALVATGAQARRLQVGMMQR
jgi:predicted phage terminase large subunit-like protein